MYFALARLGLRVVKESRVDWAERRLGVKVDEVVVVAVDLEA